MTTPLPMENVTIDFCPRYSKRRNCQRPETKDCKLKEVENRFLLVLHY